ncbi:MAG: hypothetical protein LLF92_12025 [Planctomycetaceae bacterium]|nr:hypothetical protein [Planctomycetaceae bacterium]
MSTVDSSKTVFDRIVEIMADINVIDRRRKGDRRKISCGYTGTERRRGSERRNEED